MDSKTDDRIGGATRSRYDDAERQHWDRLEALVSDAGLGVREVVKDYPAFLRRRELPRILAHYELFKHIRDLPGCVVELGVFRGSGLFTWGNLLETFCPGDRNRKVFGFDHFDGYASYTGADGAAEPWVQRVLGRMQSPKALAEGLVKLHNDDNLLPGVERVRLIDGDISETVPAFARDHLGMRLSLLYFDIGLYEPTKIGLEHLYPLVVPGGVVAFNGYGMPPWQGEAKAIEEFFAANGGMPRMEKFPFSTVPNAYFVKPGGSR